MPTAFVLGDAGANVGFAALLFLWLDSYSGELIGGEMIG